MSLYRYRYKLKKLRSSPGLTGRPSIPERQRLTERLRRTGSPAFAGDDAAREWSAAQIALSLAADTIEHGRTKKSAGATPRRTFVVTRSVAVYAFMAPFTASAVIGSERTRAPQALKIAFASAGAITVTAGSPTPVARSPLAMTLMATSGT